MKLQFAVIFSKTIRDLQIPHMEVLDTYIRNLYTNIYAPSFEAALPLPAFFHVLICSGRMRILLLDWTEYFQVWHQTKGNIALDISRLYDDTSC